MTLFGKIKDLIAASAENMIKKIERPDILADYYADRAEEELSKTRNKAASVMADIKAISREIEMVEKEAAEMRDFAKAAADKGNIEDARLFVKRKIELEERISSLKVGLNIAKENQNRLLDLYDRQEKDFQSFIAEKAAIKSNMAIASSQRAVNDYNAGAQRRLKDRISNKAARLADEAGAEAEILSQRDMDAVKGRYVEDPVERELALIVGRS